MRLIHWVLNRELLYWIVALLVSGFWGYQGIIGEKSKKIALKISGFLSEFVSSFIGWISLIVFMSRIAKPEMFIRFVDILLLILACIGISGWSIKLGKILKKP